MSARRNQKPPPLWTPGFSNPQTQQILAAPLSKTRRSSSVVSPRTPTKFTSSVKNVIDYKTMSAFRGKLREALKLMTELTIKNRANIFEQTDIVEEGKKIETQFKSFFAEASKCHSQLSKITDPNESYKVNTATLKNTAFTFLHSWKNYNALLNLIDKNGNQSILDYVTVKLDKVDIIIREITSKYRRNSVHTEELKKTGGTLMSLIDNLRENLNILLVQPQVMSNQPSLMNVSINDLKSFVHVFNTASYNVFPKSGHMQVELAQFKNEFNSACNDIINGIKCGFSFKDDMKQIFDVASDFNEYLLEIIQTLNIPTSITHAARQRKLSDSNSEDSQTTFEKLMEFVGEIEPEENIVTCAKQDLFIDSIANRMNIQITKEVDVWTRLDLLQKEFFKKLDAVKVAEDNQNMLLQKIDAQSKHMKEIIKDNAAKENSHQAEQLRLNNLINKLNDDIAMLKSEKIGLENRIVHLETINAKLRSKKNDDNTNDMLDRIGNKMSLMMTAVDDPVQQTMLPDEEDTNRLEKMNLFVLEKRCSKCNAYEQMTRDVKKKLKAIVEIPKNAPLPRVIDSFIDDYKTLESNHKQLQEDYELLQNKLQLLLDANQRVLDMIAEQLNELDIKYEAKTPEDMANAIYDAFTKLREHYENKLIQQAKEAEERHKGELEEIMKLLKEMMPGIEDDPLLSAAEQAIARIRKLDEKLRQVTYELNNANILLKHVEKWMNGKSNFVTDGLPIDHALEMMMKAIDEAPNPLQEVVDRLEAARTIYMIDLQENYLRLARVLKQEPKDPKKLSENELIEQLQSFISQIENDSHAKEFIIEQQRAELASIQSDLAPIASKFKAFLEREDINLENADNEKLIHFISYFCDEITTPGGNNLFIPVATVNKLTLNARKQMQSQLPPDPVSYLPYMMRKMIRDSMTVQATKELAPSIKTIFDHFDFNYDTFDPASVDFISVRDHLFNVHQVMNNVMNKKMSKGTVYVVQHLVSLASIFLSSVVSRSFETLTKEEQKEIFVKEMKKAHVQFIF